MDNAVVILIIIILLIAFIFLQDDKSESTTLVKPPVSSNIPSNLMSADIAKAMADTQKASRVYSSYINTDYGGGDIGLQENKTIEQCKNICDGNKDCIGFVYNKNINGCYLKNTGINVNPSYNTISEYYYTTPPTGGPALKPPQSDQKVFNIFGLPLLFSNTLVQ